MTQLQLLRAPPAHQPIHILTRRLVARTYRATDAETISDAIEESRASLTRWVPDIARRHTPAEVRAGLEVLASDPQSPHLIFGLWARSTRSYVGEAGFYHVDWAHRCAEVGYWLRATARRRGYAAEGLQLLCDVAAHDLHLDRLEAHIAVENAASRLVAERRGFRVAGERTAATYWDGVSDRMLIYALALGRPGA